MDTVTDLSECPICRAALVPLGITETYDLRPALPMSVAIDFAICSACSFVCQKHVLPYETIMRYYGDSPKLRRSSATDSDTSLYVEQAGFMSQAAGLTAKRVLDIGADMGKLLDHLAAVHGCATYYQEENATARAWLESEGRHREVVDLDAAEPFDWIVLSQVLEHVADPVAWLTTLRARLSDGGRIFIEVPNHSFWDDGDYGFSFEHLNYFSSATLVAALDRAGFVPVALAVTSHERYFGGGVRIIRVCAAPKIALALADPAAAVRAHYDESALGRFRAIDELSRKLLTNGKPELALYGAAELARQLFAHTSVGEGRIAAIFDSDARKHGRDFHGVPVRPPSDIPVVAPAAIVILSGAEADIRDTIAQQGYRGRVVTWGRVGDA
jgi:SAM-dependent methyltransferase